MDDIDASYQRPPIRHWTEMPIRADGERVSPALHDSYRRVLKEAEQVWCERQCQYGLTDFDIEDILVLCKIKVSRLMKGGVTEDSLLDLLNYAAIGLLVHRDLWKAE